MMRFGLVVNRTGGILVAVAAFMVTPLPFSLYYRADDLWAIAVSASITAGVGALMFWLTPRTDEAGHREGILIVVLAWILAAGFGALPFYLYGTFPTYTDCYFEAMSGFTTTGASVLVDIEKQPAGILFWRSLTHWIGGMGIVVLSLAVLPALGAGGMQLYKAEVPGPTTDKLVPRIRETAKRLYVVYSVISAALVLFLLAGGMPLFDSLTHMFGTMGTGGFSPKNASVGYYKSVYLEMVIAAFMYIAGANFLLHYNLLARRDVKGYLRDDEFRFYTGVIGFSVITATVNLLAAGVYPGFLEALRHSIFNVVSIITTTGFVTENFVRWPAYAHYLLLILMFIGGCAGSTGGAIKCVRILLLLRMGYGHVFKIIHPKAVRGIRFNGKVVSPEVLQGIQSMFVLYMATFVAASLGLAWLGSDALTAISAVAATLGNVGPGLGAVGPVENYFNLSLTGKWICSFCMLAGRLEVYSVFVLLAPEFWHR